MAKFKEAAEQYRMRLHAEGKLNRDSELRIAKLEKRFGNDDVSSITPAVVQEYLYKQYRGRSLATVNRNTVVLVAILRLAEELGMMTAAPRIKQRRGAGVRTTRLELDEIMPVVEHVRVRHGPLMAFCILLLIDTGMRLNEALAMRWGDLKRDWITVRQKTRSTAKSSLTRMVPASPRLLAFMETYRIVPSTVDTIDTLVVMSRWNETVGSIGRKLNDALREATAETGCLS